MSADYWLSVKSIGLSKLGGRKPCTLTGAAKHNKRELAKELETRGRIDGDRVSLNYSITVAVNADGVAAKALQLMESIKTNERVLLAVSQVLRVLELENLKITTRSVDMLIQSLKLIQKPGNASCLSLIIKFH